MHCIIKHLKKLTIGNFYSLPSNSISYMYLLYSFRRFKAFFNYTVMKTRKFRRDRVICGVRLPHILWVLFAVYQTDLDYLRHIVKIFRLPPHGVFSHGSNSTDKYHYFTQSTTGTTPGTKYKFRTLESCTLCPTVISISPFSSFHMLFEMGTGLKYTTRIWIHIEI